MILEIFLICWFITEYEPIQDLLYTKFSQIETNSPWKKVVFDNLYILLSCKKCLGFTLTLLVTMNIFTAIIVSMLGQIYDLKIKN